MNETRPVKRVKLLADEGCEDEDLNENINVNNEFARRFEHNKKRDELMRCQFLMDIY